MCTSITIYSIDAIDTIKMEIGLTFFIEIRWRDRRLNFSNILNGPFVANTTKKVLGKPVHNSLIDICILQSLDESRKDIWRPVQRIIHENAVLGKIERAPYYYLGVECLTRELSADIGSAAQNLLHSGADNDLIMRQRFKVVYPCPMDITYFPFDKQKCKFILKMETKGNQSVYLKSDTKKDAVRYLGDNMLHEFQLKNIV